MSIKNRDLSRREFSVCELGNDGPSEYDLAYQRYISSCYLLGMHEKRYREMSKLGMDHLAGVMNKIREEKVKEGKQRTRIHMILRLIEQIRNIEGECKISHSIVELCNDVIETIGNTLQQVEKTLNVLPFGDDVILSDSGKLDSALKSLAGLFEECLDGIECVQEINVKYAEIMQKISQEELLIQKNRCDELLKQLDESMLKLSSLRAAKIATECLKIKTKD